MQATVIGAGVAGLCSAVVLAERGVQVTVLERAPDLGAHNCSWFAGGMLAPWCERADAEPLIGTAGAEALRWWTQHLPDIRTNGTLVVAQPRDAQELTRFSRRTRGFEWLHAERLSTLEPHLADRFRVALLFPEEAHIDPRKALRALLDRLLALGGRVHFGIDGYRDRALWCGQVVDCTGLAARERLPGLRGVKGEMLALRSRELSLQRPVRLLHPHTPVYIVPRDEGLFMVGATMIESDDASGITARSMLELLSAAYAVHSMLGEAEIIEIGTQVRPAFADNIPRICRSGDLLFVNGLYRHGFLMAPVLALRLAELLTSGRRDAEVMDENLREWRTA